VPGGEVVGLPAPSKLTLPSSLGLLDSLAAISAFTSQVSVRLGVGKSTTAAFRLTLLLGLLWAARPGIQNPHQNLNR